MKSLRDFSLAGKKVLVRVDFNLPHDKEGRVLDDFRMLKSLPTINHLIKEGAKLILLSHLGRPGGKVLAHLRLDGERALLEHLLRQPVLKTRDCLGSEVEERVAELRPGQVLLLGNLRFHPGETKNDPRFAQALAKLGEFFVNDSFATCHRDHASVTGLPRYLPSAAGLLLEKEIHVLSRVFTHPWHPLCVIIGGNKLESKLRAVEQFLDRADDLLVGGEIANVILSAKGISLTRPLSQTKLLARIKRLNLTDPKLHLPVDLVVSPDKTGELYTRMAAAGAVRREEMILDIGPETIEFFGEVIKKAKMIIWAGPLGLFENSLFERGTREIADKVVRNHKAFKVAGGGETVLALRRFRARERFDFVSTGGSAMLRFLTGDKLPGIEALG